MSQPVKLSDALVLDARIAGEAQERSIAGQVEFWAKLGRSMELLLDGRQVLALCRNTGAQPLSEALASVDSAAGRQRLADVLERQPFPHFEQHPDQPGLLIRTDKDGKQSTGRFVNRIFTAVEIGAPSPKRPVSPAKLRNAKASLPTTPVSVRSRGKSRSQRKERKALA